MIADTTIQFPQKGGLDVFRAGSWKDKFSGLIHLVSKRGGNARRRQRFLVGPVKLTRTRSKKRVMEKETLQMFRDLFTGSFFGRPSGGLGSPVLAFVWSAINGETRGSKNGKLPYFALLEGGAFHFHPTAGPKISRRTRNRGTFSSMKNFKGPPPLCCSAKKEKVSHHAGAPCGLIFETTEEIRGKGTSPAVRTGDTRWLLN